MIQLSPSLLSADFSQLREEALEVAPLTDRYHWDVMDAHFVPNLTFGPPVVNALRPHLDKPFDIHLMIDHPAEYAPQFDVRPGDVIVFHTESSDAPDDVIRVIRDHGAGVGITLRPGTSLEAIELYLDQVCQVLVMSVEPGFGGQKFMPEALDRLRKLRTLIGERPITLAVDGGIHAGTIRSAVEAGAELLITGSAVFGAEDRLEAMRELKQAATQA